MSPRPRKASDEDLLAAAYRVMQRVAPAELTLAAIAEEAGVTAGLLVQRFGSKRGMLIRLADGAAGSSKGFLAGIRASHSSPLAALRAYVDCMAELASSPAAFVRNLAYLQDDLSDPALRKRLAKQARLTRAGLQSIIEDAVAARELTAATNAEALARTIEAIISGSMMTWAFYRRGSAVTWMREDLEAVLTPYRRDKKSKNVS
jgi:AcrR family transcriptional regulator